jgi:hypothetical protein
MLQNHQFSARAESIHEIAVEDVSIGLYIVGADKKREARRAVPPSGYSQKIDSVF